MRSSRIMLAGAVALAGGTLAGCEKPTPAVTVFSGTNSVYTKALCWAGDEPSLDAEQCAEAIATDSEMVGTPELPTAQWATVGISVDPVIAEAGWTPVIGDQPQVNEPLTETYYRFTFVTQGDIPPDGYALQVFAGDGANLRGVWAVRLVGE